MTKVCKICKETKAVELFNIDPRMKGGYSNDCKVCKVEYNRKRREMRRAGILPVMVRENKACSKCSVVKPIDKFYREAGNADGRGVVCKDCKREHVYEWRAENREKYNAKAREWGAKNQDKRHAYEIKRRYGCELPQYNSMLETQGNACAICKTAHNPNEPKGRLSVDHCHTSGQIRALLCGSCNSMLGYAKDNVEILVSAAVYIKQHGKELPNG